MRKILLDNFEYVLESGSKVIGIISETKTKYNLNLRSREEKNELHKKRTSV